MHAHPSLAFDRQGRLFYAAHCPVFSGLGTLDFQVAVATFDRDGSRFVQAVRADPTPPPEQERVRSTTWVTLAVDATHSRHSGNVYVAYVELRRLRPAGAVPERERVHDPHRALDRPRPDVLPAGRDRRPRRALHEHAGSRRGTRRHGARHVPHAPRPPGSGRSGSRARPTAAPRSRPRNWWPGSRRSTLPSSRSRPVAVLQCGDGPFACPSGFTFSAFSSFAQVTADWNGVHVIWNQELASGQSKLFVRTSPDGVSWTAPPVQVDGVPTGSPVVARHRVHGPRHHGGVPRLARRPGLRARPAAGQHGRGDEPRPVGAHLRRPLARRWAHLEGAADQPAAEHAELRDLPRGAVPLVRQPHLAVRGAAAPASSPPGPTRATWWPATTLGPTAARTASTSTPRAHGPRTPSRDRPSATRRPRPRTRASTRAGSI